MRDSCSAAGDLASDKGFATDGTFVIEQDPLEGMDSIYLAIAHRHPVLIMRELMDGNGLIHAENYCVRTIDWPRTDVE